MTVDPRLVERRKAVAEGRAKNNLRRTLIATVLFALAGSVAWMALSPWFSVSRVRTAGVVSSDANRIMAAEGVVAGTPMILIRAGQVVDALEEDPWVAQAQVHLAWPDEVVVRVIERVPVAWVRTADGWFRRAIDGVALSASPFPDETLPVVDVPDVAGSDAEESEVVLAAIEFAAAMAHTNPDTSVRVVGGELWALVAGFDVRLGRPEQMLAKARSLGALLEMGVAPGSVITVIAPSHPAVRAPVDQPEPEE
ncbi:MAG: FtsQ-type POTRA domain-containing protein [Acidimicrobiia bacterium]|nr:FtsQ-type POTRA domain-containing protein [Acidimicrobiia bacterium]